MRLNNDTQSIVPFKDIQNLHLSPEYLAECERIVATKDDAIQNALFDALEQERSLDIMALQVLMELINDGRDTRYQLGMIETTPGTSRYLGHLPSLYVWDKTRPTFYVHRRDQHFERFMPMLPTGPPPAIVGDSFERWNLGPLAQAKSGTTYMINVAMTQLDNGGTLAVQRGTFLYAIDDPDPNLSADLIQAVVAGDTEETTYTFERAALTQIVASQPAAAPIAVPNASASMRNTANAAIAATGSITSANTTNTQAPASEDDIESQYRDFLRHLNDADASAIALDVGFSPIGEGPGTATRSAVKAHIMDMMQQDIPPLRHLPRVWQKTWRHEIFRLQMLREDILQLTPELRRHPSQLQFPDDIDGDAPRQLLIKKHIAWRAYAFATWEAQSQAFRDAASL